MPILTPSGRRRPRDGSMRPSGARCQCLRMSGRSPNCVRNCVRTQGATTLEGTFTHVSGGNVSEAVCKPSSVPRSLRSRGDGHPSGAAGRPTAHAAYPRAGQRPSPPLTVARGWVAPSYSALLRVEVCRVSLRSNGLRHRPASSLWHWSSPHGGRALPATLRLRSSDFPHAAGSPRRRATIRPPR